VSNAESGSIAVATLGGTGLLLILALWLGALAQVSVARLDAATAADAAALAAAPVTFLPFGSVGSPFDEAARFARLNGADLLSCVCAVDRSFSNRTVVVRVANAVQLPFVGEIRIEAVGRAEFLPALLLDSL
jgi:hypothetical protein